jgi:hypothetical protein|tara:strand:- start:1601 stop:1768 length:168 start_codon:yes stop_codon:yes gene_type:complete
VSKSGSKRTTRHPFKTYNLSEYFSGVLCCRWASLTSHPVAFTFDPDDLGVVKESV